MLSNAREAARQPGFAWRGLFVAGVLLPWLNPAAGGPSAVVQPWLAAAASALLLWSVLAPQVGQKNLTAALMGTVLLAAIGQASPPTLLAIGGVAVVLASAVVSAKDRQQSAQVLADAWVIAASISSVLALIQYVGLSAHLAPWVNATAPGEAFANLRQRNQFATLTSIGLAALIWKSQHGSRAGWTMPASALLAAANAASASRTGALQIFLLVAMTFAWGRPMKRGSVGLCIVAVSGYAVAAVLLPQLLQHALGITAPNAFGRLASTDGCSSRGVLWSNVLHLIAQKPWLGWGWGELDYAHFSTLYPGERFCDILDNAHNLPLHLAVELGVPLAVLLTGGFLLWVALQRPWRETDPTRKMAWSVIAVIVLHSLLEYPLWYGPFQMALGLALGLLANPSRTDSVRLSASVARAVMGVPLAACLLYAAWDYHRVSQLYAAPDERSSLYAGRALPRPGDSWLFRDQLGFAQLSIAPLTMENAGQMHALAMELLHYSPEPRVIESAIASAMLLHRDDEAIWLLARYRAAFPQDYEGWSKAGGLRKPAGSSVRE